MSKPAINKDTLGIAATVVILGAIALSGWIPRDCPLLQNALGTCPRPAPAPFVSDADKELNRVAHQTVDSPYLSFTAPSQDYRKETVITFLYKTTSDQETAYLQVKEANGYHDLALITTPLLANLDWSSINEDSYRIFHRDESYQGSVASILAAMPKASELAVDKVAARDLSLSEGSYTPLENLSNLDGINYILTTYPQNQKDGTWNEFTKPIDIQDAVPNADNQLEWMIVRNPDSAGTPFHLGTVHIDYKKIKP